MTAPPSLSTRPQFTEEYWLKAPRMTAKVTIKRITRRDEDVEIVLMNDVAFLRPRAEIKQLLAANMEVELEVIKLRSGELVTGLNVPGIGWAFRMTAGDLAQQAIEAANEVHQAQMAQRAAVHAGLKATLDSLIQAQTSGIEGAEALVDVLDTGFMATEVMRALEGMR